MKLMKALLVVFVLLLVVGLSTSAMAYTRTLPSGWSLISLPQIPANYDAGVMFDQTKVNASGLLWWDNNTGSMRQIDWEENAPLYGNFGGMLLTTGYWVYSNGSSTMSYTGVSTETMDMWLSLPKAGWHLIGNPYDHGINWDNIGFTNGETTKSLADAVAANWVYQEGKIWTGTSIDYVGPSSDYDTYIWAKEKGLWLCTKIPNLAMIVNANDTPVVP